MKVLFLRNKIEYSDSAFKGGEVIKVVKNMGLYPPLGLAHIAAVARQSGHEVKIIDALAENIDIEDLLQMVMEYSPDLVALSLWTHIFKAETRLADEIKKKLPHTKIVIGGPHLDLYADETMKAYPSVDFAVISEGEETFKELLLALSENSRLDTIHGLCFRDSGRVVENPPRPTIKDLDQIPFPAVDLLPLEKYYSIVARNNRPIYMLTSRGCPFKCAYCVDQQFGRSVRLHSSDYVIDCMKWLVNDLGINEVHFYDDTFTLHKKRTLEICRRIRDEGLSVIPWTIRTRVDTVDEEMFDALWDSGCYRIGYGIEAGNQEIMDLMRKGTTLEKVRETFRLTRKHPFEIVANFMIGYLGESKKTYKDTLNFALELDPDFVYFSITQAEAHSELYNQALELNLVKPDEWKDFILGKSDSVDLKSKRFAGKDYAISDLERMQSWANVRFYLRPSKVWKHLKRTRSVKSFFSKAKMAISIAVFYMRTIINRLVSKSE